MTSQLGSDNAAAGGAVGVDGETLDKFRQEASPEDAWMLRAGSNVEHTAGATQLSAVLKQTGHTAATAGLSSAPV